METEAVGADARTYFDGPLILFGRVHGTLIVFRKISARGGIPAPGGAWQWGLWAGGVCDYFSFGDRIAV
jgi:hypothetical protein